MFIYIIQCEHGYHELYSVTKFTNQAHKT